MSYDYTKGMVCGCGNRVSNKSKSGLCRACFMVKLAADPARRAKSSATHRRKFIEDAEYRAIRLAASRRGARTKSMDPVWREKAARIMRERVQPISVATGANSDRDFDAMREKAIAARWAWCPPEYRETYRSIRAKDISAPEARRMLAEQIKYDLAKLSPFERQMRALENGAQLAANDRGPMFGECLKVAGE